MIFFFFFFLLQWPFIFNHNANLPAILALSYTCLFHVASKINCISKAISGSKDYDTLNKFFQLFKPPKEFPTVHWFNLSDCWNQVTRTYYPLTSNWQPVFSFVKNDTLPAWQSKLSAHRFAHSCGSWKHLAHNIWNLISWYLRRLKVFLLQTSDDLLHQALRQKLSALFLPTF